jgi:hypothetical protein
MRQNGLGSDTRHRDYRHLAAAIAKKIHELWLYKVTAVHALNHMMDMKAKVYTISVHMEEVLKENK